MLSFLTSRENMKYLVAFLLGFLCIFSLAIPQISGQKFKAVNLGAWLVAEEWMTPELFSTIPNLDLLDGNQVYFKSAKLNKFLSAAKNGVLVANRYEAKDWEKFRLWRISETTFNLRVWNRKFLGLDQGTNIVSRSLITPGNDDTFQIILNKNNGPLKVRIRAHNGLFLQAKTEYTVTADYGDSADWSYQNPSVFVMTIAKRLGGEYQLTNGLGRNRASQVLKEHWNTYIQEGDFAFMAANGLNAVRIPVGWWIKYEFPPNPFVGGSLQALDNAFSWAKNHNLKVIVDLHAVPGPQNDNDHSGTRDGFPEWGDSKIGETVEVIEFLAQRYGKHPSLGAIELMNEPWTTYVNFDTLRDYYKAGYDAVRRHSSAYVILSNRLGSGAQSTEFFPLARTLPNSVIDVHYYNLYTENFNNMDAQGNIEYIYNTRSAELQELAQSGGPLIFVGEWTAAMEKDYHTDEEYRRFAKAQLEVYGKASFGWSYWSFKCQTCGYWSMKRMILRNLINL